MLLKGKEYCCFIEYTGDVDTFVIRTFSEGIKMRLVYK